jgi:tRNA 2-selenouridine synthase SelU
MQPAASKVEAKARRAEEAIRFLRIRKRKKEAPAMFVEITVDDKSYLLFESFASAEHLDQGEALRHVLLKGMRSFQSQQLADMVEDYEALKQPFEEYKRDHEVLARLFSRNRELKAILNAEVKQGGV